MADIKIGALNYKGDILIDSDKLGSSEINKLLSSIGRWNSNTVYNVNDIVYYGNKFYVCQANGVTEEPGFSPAWTVSSIGSNSEPETDPTVPAWAKASTKPTYKYSEITEKPTLSTVATTGSYTDLSNKPTIPADTVLGTVTTTSSTYTANYNTADYHRIVLSGNVTLLVTNIPVGKFLTLHVNNTNGYSLTFGTSEILSSSNKGGFHILFGNPNGTIVNIGTPSSDAGDKLDPEVGSGGSGGSFTETDPTVPAWAKESTKPTYKYSEITEKPNLALDTVLGTATNVSSTYTANYNTADYHRITLTSSITLLVTNIPVGKFLVIYVNNSSGYSLTFGSKELLSTADKGTFHIVFGNPNGTIINVGSPLLDSAGSPGGTGGTTGSAPTYQEYTSTGSISLTVNPNYIYKYTNGISALTLSLASTWTTTSPETAIEFNTGTSFSGVTLPTGVKWTVPTPTFAASKRYLLVIWGKSIATATEVNK